MQRPRLNKLAIIGCAVAVVGAALALAGPSIGSAPPDDGSTGTCADFARDVNPKEIEVDSGYDAENDVVFAHTAGRTYRLVPDDPGCRTLDAVRAVMDDAVATSRENDQITCRTVSDAIAENRTAVRGRGFDREAAQRYVAERCRTS